MQAKTDFKPLYTRDDVQSASNAMKKSTPAWRSALMFLTLDKPRLKDVVWKLAGNNDNPLDDFLSSSESCIKLLRALAEDMEVANARIMLCVMEQLR